MEQLANQIINDLLNSELSLEPALLKTKVLATRIKNTNLLQWVNNELNGFDDANNVPAYRRTTNTIAASFKYGNKHYKNYPLASDGLGKNIHERLTSVKFWQGVRSLEELANMQETNTLTSEFSGAELSLIQDFLQRVNNSTLSLLEANRVIARTSVIQCISSIRANLLDFMLALESEFGAQYQIETLKKHHQQITHIMNQTINNSGDGSVINTGAHSNISATINITKGNKEQLREVLLSNNVSEDDTVELLAVIDEENSVNEAFGPKVVKWIEKMIGKAASGTWEITLGAAGSLLATAIQNYYGK